MQARIAQGYPARKSGRQDSDPVLHCLVSSQTRGPQAGFGPPEGFECLEPFVVILKVRRFMYKPVAEGTSGLTGSSIPQATMGLS